MSYWLPTSATVCLVGLINLPVCADEFHCPKRGTIITYSDGRVLTATGQVGLRCDYATTDGKPYALLVGIALAEGPSPQDKIESLWPFKIGNSTQFPASTQDHTKFWTTSIKIVGQEKISVVGRVLDTFVIEWRQFNNYADGTRTYYLAPEFGLIVKSTYRLVAGIAPDSHPWELTSLVEPK